MGTKDYGLNIYGAAAGIHDRYALSIAQQVINTRDTVLGLPGLHLMQTIVGVQVRVLGDAVLDSDSPVPQMAVGVQYKTLGSTGLDGTLDALSAKRGGTESYASATKLLLGHGATLGGNESKYSLQREFSVVSLVSKNAAVGAEYRFMRNRLETAARERAAGRGAVCARRRTLRLQEC